MAQIWMDNENAGAHMLPRSARKAMGDNPLQQSAKKSVLGKLDNMLNNKPHLTPFKGANTKFPASCAPKISLCKETLQKQHRKLPQKASASQQLLEAQFKAPQSVPNVANDLYAKSADSTNDFDLFDYMDFPSAKCLNNCQKPITFKNFEPMLNEELISKLLNTLEMDEEVLEEIPNHPDFDADDIACQPIKYKSNEIEQPKDDIFNPSLPSYLYFTDFEWEL
ncbi:uncharacterized protein LOC6576992 [Drosophila mojavensis]|uniref:Uncharacterized protein n=1 Tax=Drosophila mojavensis TaxID=7230 RepID=B4KIQ4_DROMO|nr:uncharacterized protein LOC6576992 [Drosophila mojavensis]EDW12410.1 uncharacterized protein Dmoj_GI10136 [Drosophila mojavensis]